MKKGSKKKSDGKAKKATARVLQATLPDETRDLLLEYFRSLANFYGIITLDKALDIIRMQNPELGLTEEQLLGFVSSSDFGSNGIYFDVLYPEDLLESVDYAETARMFRDADVYKDADLGILEGYDVEVSPLSQEIVEESLYAVDLGEYINMKLKQQGKPYKIIEKDELLKYADEMYIEDTPQLQKLRRFLEEELEQARAEDIFDDISCYLKLFDNSVGGMLDPIVRMGDPKKIESEKQLATFLELCLEAQNTLPKQCNRGYSWCEMEKLLGGLSVITKVTPQLVETATSFLEAVA